MIGKEVERGTVMICDSAGRGAASLQDRGAWRRRSAATRRRTPAMRYALAALAVAAVALVFGACGEDDDARGAARTVTIEVGVLPIVDLAPLYVGLDKGFFANEKLDVKPRMASSGAVIVPSVLSGDFKFGWANTTTLIIARSKGLRVRMVSRGARGGSNRAESAVDILVRSDGPVRSPKDLEGRTIGVPALQSIPTLTTNAALEKRGVDISKVRYIEVPFAEAIAALETGRIDAAFAVEPFVTLGLQAGHRSISRPVLETAPDYINATFFTTEKYIADHPDVVARFVRAVDRSFDYAAGHPEEVRDVLSTYTEIPPKVAREIRLSDFSRYTDKSTLDLTAKLAKRYGYIEKEPMVSQLFYEP
jgi:NitT/TauT family transport system substrate-binding protein